MKQINSSPPSSLWLPTPQSAACGEIEDQTGQAQTLSPSQLMVTAKLEHPVAKLGTKQVSPSPLFPCQLMMTINLS